MLYSVVEYRRRDGSWRGDSHLLSADDSPRTVCGAGLVC